MNIRDLAEALMDALDHECRDSSAVIPEFSRGVSGDICLVCLVEGLADRMAVSPSPEIQKLALELRLLNGRCDGWHEDCC
jgi:hypothetical protein